MKKGFTPIFILISAGVLIIATAFIFFAKVTAQKATTLSIPPKQSINSRTNSSPSATIALKTPITSSPTPTDDPNNFGKLVNNYTKQFNANDVGINSSLLSGKQVSYLISRFHQKEITEKKIIISDTPSYEAVEVWEFPKSSNQTTSNPDYAIFSGYENYAGWPTYLKDIESGWKEFYTNSNSIKFGFSYDGGPHYLQNVILESFQNSSVNGNPIFIRLYMNTSSMVFTDNLNWEDIINKPAILEAKDKIKQLADTISLVK